LIVSELLSRFGRSLTPGDSSEGARTLASIGRKINALGFRFLSQAEKSCFGDVGEPIIEKHHGDRDAETVTETQSQRLGSSQILRREAVICWRSRLPASVATRANYIVLDGEESKIVSSHHLEIRNDGRCYHHDVHVPCRCAGPTFP
jgi:hypothetical protein